MDSQTYEKIAMLLSKKIIFLPFGRSKKRLELLDDPVFSTKPETIKYLMELVLGGDDEVARKAIKCMRANVSAFNSKTWLWLEEDIRRNNYWDYIQREMWTAIKPNHFPAYERFGDDALLVVGLISFHNDGFIREAALKFLYQFNQGEELRYILLRANDWVPQIRNQVGKYLIKRAKVNQPYAWLQVIPYLYRLTNCRRKDHMNLIRIVEDSLTMPSNCDYLIEGLKSQENITRRLSADLICKIIDDPLKLLETGLDHNNNKILCASIQKALNNMDAEENQADRIYAVLYKSKSALIRGSSLDLLQKCTQYELVKEYQSFLTDPSLSVRESSRCWLKKNGIMDFANYYREAIKQGDQLLGAISGLGEVGTKDDAELLVPFFLQEKMRLKKATLKAIAILNPKDYVDLFIEALLDRNKNLSSVARKALQYNILLVDEKKLWNALEGLSLPEHVLDNIILIISKMPKWKCLIQLLMLYKLNYPGIEHKVNHQLANWIIRYNRSYAKPSKEEIQMIKKMLNSGDTLDQSIKARIEFLIKGIN